MDANMQLTINSFRSLFPDKIFSLTFPRLLVKSLTFHWQLSKSLTLPGFPYKWSPCVVDIFCSSVGLLFTLATYDRYIVMWQEFVEKCEMLIDSDGLREYLRLSAQQYVQKRQNPQREKHQYSNVINELIRGIEK